jgi:hypothetical protein
MVLTAMVPKKGTSGELKTRSTILGELWRLGKFNTRLLGLRLDLLSVTYLAAS